MPKSQRATTSLALLRQQGFRVTPQRQLILDALNAQPGHASPEAIYTRVQRMAPTINRATVYRTLDFLCEVRMVVALQKGGKLFYEVAQTPPHHHLICRQCDQVLSLPHAAVQAALAPLEQHYNFKVDMEHLALFGLCADCGTPRTPHKRPRAKETK